MPDSSYQGKRPLAVSIDPDPQMLDTFKEILGKEGMQVLGEISSLKGLALIRETLPDVILLEVILDDDMDGWELSQKCRAEVLTYKIPVIMVTARPRPDFRKYLGYAPPRVPYLMKPVDSQELIQNVRRVRDGNQDFRD